MGCTASKKTDEEAQNEGINRDMRKAKDREKAELKLLLLGAGDSGKTTVFKQMRILYGEGFSEDKRLALRIAVHNNVIRGAQAIVRAANEGVAGRPLQGEAAALGESLLVLAENAELSEDTAAAIALLWQDADFLAAWDERANFQVLDGWEDFAKQCHKYPSWGGPQWIPSVADAIRARVRTSGIVEERFDIDGINFTLIDVGGQRNERRKWIHCFEGVTAVIFVAAISEYDQVLFEERKKNRLEEALELFDEMANSVWFSNTNLVLFLNKSDLFRAKLCERKVPLNQSGLFPDAPLGFDFEEGAAWMKKQFLDRSRRSSSNSFFTHVTCATDTGNVQAVFDACKDSILRDSLQDLGLV